MEQYAKPPASLSPINPNRFIEYSILRDMTDGESLSEARDLIIRVRKLRLGKFEGIEYLLTLSATTQTEMYYARQVVLFDEQLNVLNVTGMPIYVAISDKANWREAYQQVDEANLAIFHQVLESIVAQ